MAGIETSVNARFQPRAAPRTAALVLALALLCAAAGCARADADSGTAPGGNARAMDAASLIDRAVKEGVRAPDFGAGRPWLNVARPLTLAGDLSGRVVLLDFWTYGCINCMHILPDLAYLEQKYDGRPFAIVGVHSAKFENERGDDTLRQAVLRYDIRHPVVNDADFAIWSAYAVNAWPTLVLVGPDRRILATLRGEGHRAELDALIGAALARYERTGLLHPKELPLRPERPRGAPGALAFPGKLALDAVAGRVYVADTNHDRIVVTDLAGHFLAALGAGVAGLADGDAKTARFHRPRGVALAGGTLYVADTENHALRAVDLDAGRLDASRVRTIAGDGTQGDDRTGGGPAARLRLSSPWDVAVVGDAVFVAMAGTHQLWRYVPRTGEMAAYAGSGSEARVDGPRAEAALAQPSGLAATADGQTLVFADSESSSVRALDLAQGVVRTLAGAKRDAGLFAFGDRDGTGFEAKLQHPLGVAVAGAIAFVADTYNHRIKRLDLATGRVTTLAGTGRPGLADGPFAKAQFDEPSGLAFAGDPREPDKGRLYVADTDNHRVRVLDLATGTVSTLALTGVPAP